MTANDASMTITTPRHFADSVRKSSAEHHSLLCVGLDPDFDRFPASIRSNRSVGGSIVEFNKQIIAATSEYASAFKPNLAFYMQYGVDGFAALLETRAMIPAEIPAILDCKIGDISSTMEPLARAYLDNAGFDAITVNPYLGGESLAPAFARAGKGVFVLCKTSNPGSGEIQNLGLANGEPLFAHIARTAVEWDRSVTATVGLVTGATYPEELKKVRELAPDLLILVPGIGSQAGDLAAAVDAGLDANGTGMLVNSSRSISYASGDTDFATAASRAARTMRDAINTIR